MSDNSHQYILHSRAEIFRLLFQCGSHSYIVWSWNGIKYLLLHYEFRKGSYLYVNDEFTDFFESNYATNNQQWTIDDNNAAPEAFKEIVASLHCFALKAQFFLLK